MQIFMFDHILNLYKIYILNFGVKTPQADVSQKSRHLSIGGEQRVKH